MHTIASAVVGALLTGALVLASGPARANCAADATGLEASLAANPSHPKATKITNMIAKARAGLADGKEKKCANIIAKAKAQFGTGQKKAGGGGAAACAAKADELQRRADGMPAAHPKQPGIMSSLEKARSEAAEGKKKHCEKLTAQVEMHLGKAGF